MDIQQMRYFRAVVDAGSFTRAAETLHMTQSALSRSIAKLEDELGLRLFERDGNHITLNRFGERFLHDSALAISCFDDSIHAVRELAGLEQGDVSVGVSKDVFLDHIIRQFLIDHPEAAIHAYLLSPEQMIDALETGEVDFVLTTSPPSSPFLVWEDLYLDQLEVLMSRSHPLASSPQIHLEQLRNDRFVVASSNYNMEDILRTLCALAGFEPKILYEGTSNDMPMYFVDNGSALMVTPHSINRGVADMIPPRASVLSIPLADEYPGIRKMIRAGFREGHYLSQASKLFFEQVTAFYRSIGS